MVRKFTAEALGTGVLVSSASGVATLMLGFHFAGASTAAGVVAIALAFGLVLLALVYTLGPVTGCHVNPAVTLGALLAGRIKAAEAVAYWIGQFAGGISAPCCCGRCLPGLRFTTGQPPAWAPTAGGPPR